MPFRSADVLRNNIVTIPELFSDGYGIDSIYLCTSLNTTSATQTVTITLPADDVSLLYEGDYQVESGDIIYLYATQPGNIADGYYTISQVLTDTSFTVNEPISDSTDGYIQFRYQAGATLVGLNSTGMMDVQGNTVQEAIQELDSSKLNSFNHETIRQLIHFIDEGPGDGFASGAYKVISPASSIFPTNITWYFDSTMSQKIVEKTISWNGVVPITINWEVYNVDGVTVAHTISDSISYTNNIFETHRTRTIT